MAKEKSQKERKPKNLKYKRHPFKYFNVFLFLFGLLLILNFSHIVYWMHPDSYVEVYGTTIEEGKDPILGILPRTKFSYNFEGKPYVTNKTLYNKIFFVADTSQGYPLYVNRKSPEDTLVLFPIYRCFLSFVLLLLMFFCVWQIVLGFVKNHKRRKYRKQLKAESAAEANPVKTIALKEGEKVKLSANKRLVLVEHSVSDEDDFDTTTTDF